MKFTKYLKLTLLCLFIIIIGTQLALAQNLPPSPPETTSETTLLTFKENVLSIAVLVFGLITVFCEVFLATRNQGNIEEILKLIVITIIIVSGLFIITAGLSTDQVAPAFGLYGAITGYLLGKESKTKE